MPFSVENRGPNFEQKNYFTEDETRWNEPLFRWNSACFVKQKTYGIPFRVFRGGGELKGGPSRRGRSDGVEWEGENEKGGRVGGVEAEGVESEGENQRGPSRRSM
jgi:hypothetical protein